ncbi:MAG TPA: DNA-formamidopyrimidine glycosylase [Syntrophales bacterium]|nr:DNA-formamidopyrimidine glycosylase [Syntrophales bacterium]HOX93375.1 DNA-formamidopyrimidine glycosylase [Syntrophales bacterium]HPI56080.1 DNA-formamidopyrimidine glycosylase [Syntrophales bacterium]HPN24030.1 DNA-formamidopyrimidine glycosylase [Syntrophales bacterium]HQM28309.1 DNA-formamidopyrimidine glycosylase [Syntrophales bacterium]
MPELPEVETLCRQLRQVVLGARIREGRILDDRLGKMENPAGKRVLAILRRGKAFQFQLEGSLSLFFQLRMTGRFHWQETGVAPPRARFLLAFPHGSLFLTDLRRLATLRCSRGDDGFPRGCEPLDGLDRRRIFEIAGRRRLPVKNFLMDQNVVAGIGNIYASEILFRSRISPLRETSSLSLGEWGKIIRAMTKVLCRAVQCRGTSISDWKDLHGRKGEYQAHLRVYGREGGDCFRCGRSIRRIVLSGRGTFYCPACQR